MSHQIRPGVRGGRDQFSWDQVKEDKQRSNYLGSSIHGVPDKFKKGPETFWYAKEKITETNGSETSEIKSIKAKEKQMMEALLGVQADKSVHLRSVSKQVEKVSVSQSNDQINRQEHRRDGLVNDDSDRNRRIERFSKHLESYDRYNRDRESWKSRDSYNNRDRSRDFRTRERSPRRRNRSRSRSRSPKMYK
jgi:hypothetical protein